MSIVLAALDTTAAARPVLETALRIGELTAGKVEAVHVRIPSESVETPESLARRSGVPLRLLTGPVVPALLAASGAPDVIAVVIGARATPSGRRPVGRVARQVLEKTDKPVVVVPPEAVSPGVLRRLLIPLEGTELSSRPVIDQLRPLIVTDIDALVLHVFTDATLPVMIDHPEYDMELLGTEFLTRHFPHTTHIELRPGPVAKRVAEVAAQHGSDLVVLSWSQTNSPDRATVVREVLAASALPVLLLPAPTPPG